MRVVIYDRDDMEPITVITLPGWARQFLREVEENGRSPFITFPVQLPIGAHAVYADAGSVVPIDMSRSICRLHFEPIWKNSGGKAERLMWLCTTMDGESALLLKSTFLPGQQAAVNEVRRDAFLDGLMAAIRA